MASRPLQEEWEVIHISQELHNDGPQWCVMKCISTNVLNETSADLVSLIPWASLVFKSHTTGSFSNEAQLRKDVFIQEYYND